MVEVIKTDKESIERMLSTLGYRCYPLGYMLLAVHADDPLGQNITVDNGALSLGRF